MPAKKKKDLFCRSGKRTSRKDQDSTTKAETLPEAEKNQAGRKRSRIILFANQAVTGKI